ncbi:hypothetical protein B296_00056753 [Ensete ventricosum]|uniref:Uncharacterized protein n=1 Tax=Ensete ventricosum TaxID=4639 RepID=A0A426XU05_ENSVE|nr:hypothetical protein B296_00056753 [Ensete ventricosum]
MKRLPRRKKEMESPTGRKKRNCTRMSPRSSPHAGRKKRNRLPEERKELHGDATSFFSPHKEKEAELPATGRSVYQSAGGPIRTARYEVLPLDKENLDINSIVNTILLVLIVYC